MAPSASWLSGKVVAESPSQRTTDAGSGASGSGEELASPMERLEGCHPDLDDGDEELRSEMGLQRMVTVRSEHEEYSYASSLRDVEQGGEVERFGDLALRAARSTRLELKPIGPDEIFKFFDDVRIESILRWAATVGIAVACALTAGGILLSSSSLVRWKLRCMRVLFMDDPFSAFCFWFGYGLAAAFLATLFVTLVQPSAGGSGVPDVKAYLNGNLLPGTTSLTTWLGRVVGLPLVTSSGLFAGMQGPMAHVGAITAAGLSTGHSRFFSCHIAFLSRLNNHKSKLEFMSQGAAFGVAAAFGAPIGGLLFSLEEASTNWSPATTCHTFLGACIASLIAKFAKTGFRSIDPIGFIEFPGGADEAVWSPWELIPFMGIAVVLGLAGALFCKIVRYITQLRVRVFRVGKTSTQIGRHFKTWRIIETLLVTAVTLIVSFFLVTHVPCVDIPAPSAGNATVPGLTNADVQAAQGGASGSLVGWVCRDPAKQASGIATVLLDTRENAIKALFSSSNDDHFPETHLALLFMTIYGLYLFTNGLSLPVGSFVPSIMIGASFGRLVGKLVVRFVVATSLVSSEEVLQIHTGVYALMGAAAMLAGVSRMTVSLGAVMLEITGSLRLTLPLMLVIMTSKIISDTITPSACDIMIALRGIPMLGHECLNRRWRDLEKVLIKDCGTSRDIRCVYMSSKLQLRDAYRLLAETQHQSWPVLADPESRRLLGLLTRAGLEQCLRAWNMLSHYPESSMHTGDTVVDISRVIDRRPHVMWSLATFMDAYKVFRALQLRTLCIVDERYALCCIVTRNDLAEVIEERTNPPIMEMRDLCEHWNFDDTSDRLTNRQYSGGIFSSFSRRTCSAPNSATVSSASCTQDSYPILAAASTRNARRAARRGQWHDAADTSTDRAARGASLESAGRSSCGPPSSVAPSARSPVSSECSHARNPACRREAAEDAEGHMLHL